MTTKEGRNPGEGDLQEEQLSTCQVLQADPGDVRVHREDSPMKRSLVTPRGTGCGAQADEASPKGVSEGRGRWRGQIQIYQRVCVDVQERK